MKRLLHKFFHKLGYKISRVAERPPDIETEFWEFYELCKPYTMTSFSRMYCLYQSIRHVLQANLDGDIVECGVWKGGSAMIAALVLAKYGDKRKRLFLYDTYAGMTRPSEQDVSFNNEPAIDEWSQKRLGEGSDWCLAQLEEVRQNLALTGLSPDRFVFIQGPVEETIPGTIPEKISLLRLDTDWYSSTYHELVHLYPRLQQHGILIVDDYGYWRGAREAVDTYFSERNAVPFLQRIDHTGRVMVKTEA